LKEELLPKNEGGKRPSSRPPLDNQRTIKKEKKDLARRKNQHNTGGVE